MNAFLPMELRSFVVSPIGFSVVVVWLDMSKNGKKGRGKKGKKNKMGGFRIFTFSLVIKFWTR